MPSTRQTVSTLATGCVTLAASLALGACGASTPATVTPAGAAVTASPASGAPTALPTSAAPEADSTSLSVPGGGVGIDASGNTTASIPGGGIAVDADGNPTVALPGLGGKRIGDFGSTGTVTLKGSLSGTPTVTTARCNAAGGPRDLTATLEGGIELRVTIVSAEIADITVTKGKAEWRGSWVTDFADVATVDDASFTVKGAQLSPDSDIDTGVAVATGVVTVDAVFDC